MSITNIPHCWNTASSPGQGFEEVIHEARKIPEEMSDIGKFRLVEDLASERKRGIQST